MKLAAVLILALATSACAPPNEDKLSIATRLYSDCLVAFTRPHDLPPISEIDSYIAIQDAQCDAWMHAWLPPVSDSRSLTLREQAQFLNTREELLKVYKEELETLIKLVELRNK